MPQVHASLVIDAPVSQVWDRIKDFHDFSWAPGIVTSCIAVGDVAGNEPGAKRFINEAFLDRLIEYDTAGHGYKYAIEDAPSPVSPAEVGNFVGHLRLSAADGDRTLAEYSGDWELENDEASSFMDEVYSGLLGELSQRFGAGSAG